MTSAQHHPQSSVPDARGISAAPGRRSRFSGQAPGLPAVLLLGGLSGPGACITTPFFLLRAWKDRNHERLIQGAILSLCTVVQGSLLCLFPTQGRGLISPAVYLLSMWTQSVGLIPLGVYKVEVFASFFSKLYQHADFWLLPVAAACAIVVTLVVVFFARTVPPRDRWGAGWNVFGPEFRQLLRRHRLRTC